jgi:Uncharacterized protein conserved in bacteria (DUF2188)
MPKKDQQVVPSGDRWSVRSAGAARASATYATQREAVDKARSIARNQGTELYIYGKDGRIKERTSYGRDPLPAKG